MRWLRVTVKRLLARVTLVMEFCHTCGRDVGVVWTAPDALWEDLVGDPGGVLCVDCFDELAAGAGLFVRWIPTVERDTRLVKNLGAYGEVWE